MTRVLAFLVSLSLTAFALAQQQTQPGQQQTQQQTQQTQPGQQQTQPGQIPPGTTVQPYWQLPNAQQRTQQIETAQGQLDDLFDRLLEQADEAERQDIEQIRNEMNRLIDNLLIDIDTMGRQQMTGATTDQQRVQQLEQRLDALERQTRVQRALDRAQRDLQGMRTDIIEGTDRERTGQEFARIRGDLERAFEGVEGTARQRWEEFRSDFDAFEQRLRDEEDITEEDVDEFIRGFDFTEEFGADAWHDRPIAYQLDPNVAEQRRRALTEAQARLEGLREDITADVLDSERIAQELEDIRSNLESFFEQQFGELEGTGTETAERDWWVVIQMQWIDLEEQLRTGAPTAGIAEAYATLLEELHQRGLQAAQQERQQGLADARTRLEEIRTQEADEESREFRAGEVAQLRAQLRQQFRDAEGEDQQTWNRLRRQLMDVEQQIRTGESVDDATWDQIMQDLPEGGNGNGMQQSNPGGTGN